MAVSDVLGNLQVIQVEKPVDKIINQLKHLIISGQLKPGDRLPPERLLSDKFGVGRGYIREAIMKLEFYGLLKTSPQSGTYVSGFSLKVMDSIFSDIIKFNKEDFESMMEGRYLLEINAAKLAAIRRTDDDILQMKDALKDFDSKVKNNENAVDDDMLFHIKLAGATKNTFIESMLLVLIPDLIKNINDKKICVGETSLKAINEHHQILDAIISRDVDAVEKAMQIHLSNYKGLQISA